MATGALKRRRYSKLSTNEQSELSNLELMTTIMPLIFVYRFISGSTSQFCISPKKSNIVRCLSSKTQKKIVSDDSIQNKKWTAIYHLPMIKLAHIVNRFKLYQSLFTLAAVPTFIVLYYNGMTNLTTVAIVTGTATFTCITLCIATYFFQRLIGTIFVDESLENMRIAHLTFWGKRNDLALLVDDIIPLTDGNCSVSDAFVKVHRCNSKEVLYLSVRFGRILNPNVFEKIFGSFEILGIKK